MNRYRHIVPLLLVCWTLAGSDTRAIAQSHNTSREPENHDIVVDRLLKYHDYGTYDRQIRDVVDQARDYLNRVLQTAGKGEKLAAVFDIDETSLSNWEAMAKCGFCAYAIRTKEFPDFQGPAITPVLELFNFAKAKGVYLFFVTGRQEARRKGTIQNLTDVGYAGWTELMMQPDGNTFPASTVKPQNRRAIIDKGYRIVLNIGDQDSDLAGCCAERVFKLPNPFYLLK